MTFDAMFVGGYKALPTERCDGTPLVEGDFCVFFTEEYPAGRAHAYIDGQWQIIVKTTPMDPMDFIKVVRALQELPEEDFRAICRENYPTADDAYIDEKWQVFQMNPQYFVATRHPIKPGLDLIKRAIELAGVKL